MSMLTEGWDVKNVFRYVPHESRAFSSKLLISQVLGRGLRVPPNMDEQPTLLINNHEAWSEPIRRILREVLEVEDLSDVGVRRAFIASRTLSRSSTCSMK
ncbi:MAG: hypothetical protein R3C09_08470 [Pirellulaceae bacterium]